MNKISQSGQMDIYIRFISDSLVETRYLTSVFLRRQRAEDILEAFNDGINKSSLSQDKILQVSMDGPSVNHKFLRCFKSQRAEHNQNQIIDCGTCSLHIVCGSLKTADSCDEFWNVGAFLMSCYYVFHDSPMRRALFLELNKIDESDFPLKFCPTRWVENSKVASRVIELLPKLKCFTSDIDKKVEPKSSSYKIMKEKLKDPLFPVKLAAFNSIAYLLEKFCTEYQTDQPMLPFLFDDLSHLLTKLIKKVAKEESISGKSSVTIAQLNIKNEINLKCPLQVDLGYEVLEQIRKQRHLLKSEDILHFRKQYTKFIVTLVSKLQERSPLKHGIVKGSTCLNPTTLASESAISRLEIALGELVSHDRLTGIEADCVKEEYEKLSEDHAVRLAVSIYSRKTRLDDFYFNKILKDNTCQPLIKFVSYILVLSHGQATVERGFNINKELLVENQKETSLIALRRVYDSVSRFNVPLSEFEITKGLIIAARSSHSRYKLELEKMKNSNISTEAMKDAEKKRKLELLHEKMEEKKKLKLEADLLEKEINSLKQKI